MDSFDNLMKAACHIKSYQLSFDKKSFEKLPEFYKTGLYCSDMTKNIRSQKDFVLQKSAFEVLKDQGIQQIAEEEYDDANYFFCKSLCIFKYITSKNKNWKNEGVKDEELEYFETEGNTPEERNEIKQMKISALLNIALCDLNTKKFDEVRYACDEVLKLDQSNIKAYYRKAKSYLDCKSSVHEDYVLAFKELEKALKYSPNDPTILPLYNKLKIDIEKHNKDEKKVFKSFFRNVNYEQMQKEDMENLSKENSSDKKTTDISEEDPNLGKPEIRILNLVIEQCYVLIHRLEREGNKKELKRMQAIVEKAKFYKEDLQKLLELNFEKPNDDLRKFAKEHKLDLNDPNVKNEFFKIRKSYLEKINNFYEDNLLKFKPGDIAETLDKVEKSNKNVMKRKMLDKKADSSSKIEKSYTNKDIPNKSKEFKQSEKNDLSSKTKNIGKYNINYSLIFVLLVFLGVIFYFVYERNSRPSHQYYDEY